MHREISPQLTLTAFDAHHHPDTLPMQVAAEDAARFSLDALEATDTDIFPNLSN